MLMPLHVLRRAAAPAVPARGRDPARGDRRSRERPRDRRAAARDPLPALARRGRPRGHRSPSSTGSRRSLGSRRRARRTIPTVDEFRGRRPRGGGRRLRRADRANRQLDHPPGGRGRGERHPLRGAGGRPGRPFPDRRRPARGAADSQPPDRRGDDAAEGAREAGHRRAPPAAGRPDIAPRRRRGQAARHPSRDAADRRRRDRGHAPPRQVEERADARGARALGGDARPARAADRHGRRARFSSQGRRARASRRRCTRA